MNNKILIGRNLIGEIMQMNNKSKLFPFRISENMLDALRKKLNGTRFNMSLAMRASVARLLNMGLSEMIDWIDMGARMVDRPTDKSNPNGPAQDNSK